jgi:hypothetical protein
MCQYLFKGFILYIKMKQIVEEPYGDKNNLFSQMEFLNKFLPLYGIESLCDTATEIDSKKLTDFDKMTEYIPEIKKLFKTSVMNLNRSMNKITSTNAIPILKHMCVQSRIPYNIIKYSNNYTFSLADQNFILTNMREKGNCKIVKEKCKTKPYKYFDNLPYTDVESPVLIKGNKEICFKAGGVLADDISHLVDSHHISELTRVYVETRRPSVRFTGIYTDIVRVWYENRGQKFISIQLGHGVDIYRRVKSVKLYDKKGLCIHQTNKVDIAKDCFNVPDNCKNLTDIHVPLWSLLYQDISMNISYDGEDPWYYIIEMECTYLGIEYHKLRCGDWNGGEIKQNNLLNNKIEDMPEFIGDVKVKWRCLSQCSIPKYGRVIRNIRSTDDFGICFNDLGVFTTNNLLIPLFPYVNTSFYLTDQSKECIGDIEKISEAVFEYDDIVDDKFEIDGNTLRMIDNVFSYRSDDFYRCNKCSEVCSKFCSGNCGTFTCEKCSLVHNYNKQDIKVLGHYSCCKQNLL